MGNNGTIVLNRVLSNNNAYHMKKVWYACNN
jgi:hypothetical protein